MTETKREIPKATRDSWSPQALDDYTRELKIVGDVGLIVFLLCIFWLFVWMSCFIKKRQRNIKIFLVPLFRLLEKDSLYLGTTLLLHLIIYQIFAFITNLLVRA